MEKKIEKMVEKRKAMVKDRRKMPHGQSEIVTSRLIVKNIPKYATEKRVKDFFAKVEGGVHITDVKVLKTPAGVSRQLAFVGFKDEAEAAKAKSFLNKAFFDTCRVSLSFALPYGDSRIKRPWSKHSKQVSQKETATAGGKRSREEEPEDELKRKKNAKLAEFLAVMQPRSQSKFWSNDDSANHVDEMEEEESEDSENEESAEIASGEQTKKKEDDKAVQAPKLDLAQETGRLFVRNLPFATTEEDLEKAFSKFGPVTETHIPVDEAKRSRGFGYVTFMIPEHAIKAISALDGQIFQGRLLHVLPSFGKPEDEEGNLENKKGGKKQSSFQAKKEAERKEKAGDSKSWNALFIRGDAAVEAVANELGVGKGDLLLADAEGEEDGDTRSGPSPAVRMALAETRIIAETKRFLEEEGVDVELLEKGVRDPGSVPRSKTCLLVKNLPASSDKVQLRQMFSAFGEVASFVMPPSKTMALVSFFSQKDAKKAFRGLAYRRYREVPLYLEWSPENVLSEAAIRVAQPQASEKQQTKEEEQQQDVQGEQGEQEEEEEEEEQDVDIEAGKEVEPEEATANAETVADVHTVFVKNLNFETKEDALRKLFESKVGKGNVLHVSIPTRKSSSGAVLSSGFGFVEFPSQEICKKALRLGRGSTLDGHELELKISERKKDVVAAKTKARKSAGNEELSNSTSKAAEKITKIVIRNLAFEANKKELKQLVSAYGQVNSIRIPKKFDGTHRGFAFVDFVTHQEAKAAFAALTNTHLYGRHLVIEWAEEKDTMESLREKASKQLNKA